MLTQPAGRQQGMWALRPGLVIQDGLPLLAIRLLAI